MIRIAPIACLLFIACHVLADDLDAVSGPTVDLEAVETLRTVSPVDGKTVSGQPSPAALEVFADSGYAAVIDLRDPSEPRAFDEQSFVEDLGMNYINLPVSGGDDVNYDNAVRLNQILADFDAPVLLHCASGNRVGALLALGRRAEGATSDEALAYGLEHGLTGLERVVKERLENEPDLGGSGRRIDD